MDLSTIIDHLDNFTTAWKGWASVFEGIDAFTQLGKVDFAKVSSEFVALSSTSSK
ncbi:MAG: hypothetical protein ACTH7R_10050 [Corynebacterium flavescens]|uniref:hypothetical protein n=1 Tax=Corynebacterium flavescens TaxID=28028 RepID=UPI003F90FC99